MILTRGGLEVVGVGGRELGRGRIEAKHGSSLLVCPLQKVAYRQSDSIPMFVRTLIHGIISAVVEQEEFRDSTVTGTPWRV